MQRAVVCWLASRAPQLLQICLLSAWCSPSKCWVSNERQHKAAKEHWWKERKEEKGDWEKRNSRCKQTLMADNSHSKTRTWKHCVVCYRDILASMSSKLRCIMLEDVRWCEEMVTIASQTGKKTEQCVQDMTINRNNDENQKILSVQVRRNIVMFTDWML